MLKNKIFAIPPLDVNTYVVSDDTKEAVIIDCGCFSKDLFQPIADYIAMEGLKPVHMLCTHFHFDHVAGLHYVKAAYGLDPEGSALDEEIYDGMEDMVKSFLGTAAGFEFHHLPLARRLVDGNQVHFGTHQLQVIHTPGHTPGGLCFYSSDGKSVLGMSGGGLLWSGDTLFRGSVGRTDLEGGDFHQLVESIRERLFVLPGSTKVFPGHGPATSINYECSFNPFL